jgi:sulfide:quinone oxidoreductase
MISSDSPTEPREPLSETPSEPPLPGSLPQPPSEPLPGSLPEPPRPSEPLRVVIAGGGIAGVEAALALRDLAGERVALTLLAPNSELVYRPMAVREPFAYGAAQRYPLERIARDVQAELVRDAFGWVDADARIAHTESGAELPYDALLIAIGARARPHFEHALTIDDRRLDALLHGVIQDVEAGYVHRIAFVVPGRMGWQLPIYELALMTAARAYDANVELAVTIVTPEETPLALFGLGASSAVAQLLEQAGITTITSAYAEVPSSGQIVVNPGDRHLEADRIIALPELFGPAVRGLHAAAHGFIPVDVHNAVLGVERVYAAGDAVDFAVKHGGLSTQQADAAAEAIAALAGVPIEPKPFYPVVHGILLTGGDPLYLTARITGGHGFSSELSDIPTWSPPSKIAARYLAPYLAALDAEHAQTAGA